MALGGSTNAVLHLLAIAKEAKLNLSLRDFERIGKKTPVLADLKPFGSHYMSELNASGGIQPLMKTLLEKGLKNGIYDLGFLKVDKKLDLFYVYNFFKIIDLGI